MRNAAPIILGQVRIVSSGKRRTVVESVARNARGAAWPRNETDAEETLVRLTRTDVTVATVLALLVFTVDWSGCSPYRLPNFCAPHPLAEVWWHLPAIEAAMVGSAALVLAFWKG